VTLFAASLFAAACGKDTPPAGTGGGGGAAHESHVAPHKGEILELGEEEAHVEVVHDAKAGTITLYVYGKDLKSPVAVETPTILLNGADGTRELKPTAVDAKAGEAKATTWKLTDPGLTTDPIDGRLRITVDGKTHQAPLEPAGHGH
jgi:hypothetical protein